MLPVDAVVDTLIALEGSVQHDLVRDLRHMNWDTFTQFMWYSLLVLVQL